MKPLHIQKTYPLTEISVSGVGYGCFIESERELLKPILVMGVTKEEAEQRAELIEKLVNNHKEIMEVLKEANVTISLYTNNKIGDGSANGRLMEQIDKLSKKITE